MNLSTREIALAGLFTAIMCVLTIMIRVFQPVMIIPFSLQPLVVILAACLLSPRAAFLSMLAYLCIGLIGIPVFSKPPYAGLAYIFLPSFGFLLGFPFAAWIQSKLIRENNLKNFILAGLVGVIVMYLFGLPYMYIILNYYLGNTVDIMRVLELGFIPFITFDVIKVILAALLALEISRRLNLKREY